MKNLDYNELLSILIYNLDQNNLKNRYFIALAGPPASGKSTISQKLNEDFNTKGLSSEIFQMDGFHFDDAILNSRNLLPRKGSPETFDVMGLKNFLIRLANEPEVVVPVFDRRLELSRSSAVTITEDKKIIIVEGNYLLLNSHPWSTLNDYFNSRIMIHCEESTLEKRLIERWKGFDLNQEQINQKVYKNDLPNGVNVIQNSIEADYYLEN
ncbi:nucleoside/nucleotide kinase family protein [Alphaproteobacteria bacterium]|nr:nucleoside/nucleotide kinase family protein [Alphaproteobacteria bacterium]